VRKTPVKSSVRMAKQERARVTIDVVLNAAAQVLIREGYARTTTNRIADRAGVSVGSIYQYFENKEAVLARLMDREIERVLARLDSSIDGQGKSLGEALRGLLTVAVEAWSYGPVLYRQLEQVPDNALRRRVTEGKSYLTAFIRSLLEAHKAELRVEDLDVATFVVINASIGLSTTATPEMYGERLVDATVELLERYLVA
jgi:AcrR family transcriptional regulator